MSQNIDNLLSQLDKQVKNDNLNKKQRKKMESIMKRLNKEKNKSNRTKNRGSTSAKKHQSKKRPRKSKKPRSSTSKKSKTKKTSNATRRRNVRRVRRRVPQGQRARHRMRRNKWITNKSQFRQAMRRGDTDVYQVKYKICLLRYDKVSFETHEDTFELPKDSSKAQVKASVELLVKDHIESLRKEYGYDIEFYTDDDTANNGFEVTQIIKISNANQLSVYLSNGGTVVNLVTPRFNTISNRIHWYESDSKCWITAICQAYYYININNVEDFVKSKQKGKTFKSELEIEQEIEYALSKLDEGHSISDGLSIAHIMWWARYCKVPLWLNIWLPSGEKYYISEQTDKGYTEDNCFNIEDRTGKVSWKSPASLNKNSSRVLKMHIEINNHHIYPRQPRKKKNSKKGHMLSQVNDLNNLRGEFVKFSNARRIGIKNYKVIDVHKKNNFDKLKIIKNKLVRGMLEPQIRTLIITWFSFDEIMTAMVKFAQVKGKPLPLQANPKSKSLVHPTSHQLYIFINKDKDIENYKMITNIRKKIHKIYNREIKSQRKSKMLLNFSCGNQSVASIARNLFHWRFGHRLPNSKYNLWARDVFDIFFTKPITQSYIHTSDAIVDYYYKWGKIRRGDFTTSSGIEKKNTPYFILRDREKDIDYYWWISNEEAEKQRQERELSLRYFEGFDDDIYEDCNKWYWNRITDITHHLDVRRSYPSAILRYFTNQLKIPVYSVCDNIEYYDGGEIKCGFYFVNNFTIKGKYYEIPIEPQFLPHFEVEILMQKYGLKKENIKYQYLPRQYHTAEMIRDYVVWVCKNFDGNQARNLINVWTGTTKYTRVQSKHSFITQDKEFVACYINWKQTPNIKTNRILIDKNDRSKDYWMVYNEDQMRKTFDTMSIYQYIIGAGHLNLLSLLDECMTEKSILVGTKTDSAYIVGEINTDSHRFIHKDDIPKNMKSNVEHLLKTPYQIEDEWNPNDVKEKRREISITEEAVFKKWLQPINQYNYKQDVDYSNDCTLTQGDGGSGKTRELLKLYIKYKQNDKNNVRVFAYTHSAVENLVESIEKYVEEMFIKDHPQMNDELRKQMDNEKKYWMSEMRNDVSTLDAFFGFEGNDNESKDLSWTSVFQDKEIAKIRKIGVHKLTHMLTDEYSMLSKEKYYHFLYRVRMVNDKVIIKLFGDINQCPATDKILYDIRDCQVLRSILMTKTFDDNGNEKIEDGYIINMQYRKGSQQRCDDDIMEVVNSLKTDGTLPKKLFKNHDREHPNKDSYRRWITYGRDKTIRNNAIVKPPDSLTQGDEVICCANKRYDGYDSNGNALNKKIPVWNNERLTVLSQRRTPSGRIRLTLQKKDGTIVSNVCNEIIERRASGLIRYLFTLDKSETVYKYQGMTIKKPEKYIIQEGTHKRMTREMMITAFSRGEKFNQMYLEDYKKVLKLQFPSAYEDKSMKEIEIDDMQQMKVFKMYLMTEITSQGQPNMYYVGQEELIKNEEGKMTRTLKDRKNEHINNGKEKWSQNAKITLIGHHIAHNRQEAELVEAMLIQDYKHMDKYKDWKLMNDIYNKKKSDKIEYESNTDQVKITLDDWIERLFPRIRTYARANGDRQNKIVCHLNGQHWFDLDSNDKYKQISYTPIGEKQRKKPNKAELIPYLPEAQAEMREWQEQLFNHYYPTLYKMLKNEEIAS